MSYDLIIDSRKLVELRNTKNHDQLYKILKSEFSKWNHPIRMKFLVAAATECHAHDFLNDLLDIARDKNALMTGPIVFEQMYHWADKQNFKQHAFELAQKSLTLRPPKQLHNRCADMAYKGQWMWAGMLFPYIKDEKVVVSVYKALLERIEVAGSSLSRKDHLCNELHQLIVHDAQGLQRWKTLPHTAHTLSVAEKIDAQLVKDEIEKSLDPIERHAAKRKM